MSLSPKPSAGTDEAQRQVALPGATDTEECSSASAIHSTCLPETKSDANGEGSILRRAAIGEVRKAASELLTELSALEEKHTSERIRCLESWLQRRESAQELLTAELSPGGPPTLAVTVCEGSMHSERNFHRPHGQMPPKSGVQKSQHANAQQSSRLGDTSEFPKSDLPKGHTEGSKQSNENTQELSPEDSKLDQILSGMQRANLISVETKRRRKKAARFPISTKSEKREITQLQAFTSSRIYELCSLVLILMNAAFHGWEVQWSAERSRETQEPSWSLFFVFLRVFFTLGFVVEVGLRWVAWGFWPFFAGEDYGWCIFDVAVVGWSLIDLFIVIVLQAATDIDIFQRDLSILRVLRTMRIVKIFQVIRVMHFFRELRMMMYSIMGSLKSLLWVLIVLTCIFFMFSIILTKGADTFLTSNKLWEDPAHRALALSFGTMDRSMLTLFMAVTGGNDWSVYYEALAPCAIQFKYFLVLYVVFTLLAVMNIVTGIFVQSAIEANKHDRELVIHEELEHKKEYCKEIQRFFEEIDEDGTGTIGFDEFQTKLDDDRVVAYFNALQLDVSDAHLLFQLMDFDSSGEINIDEFILGCHQFHGETRKLDMKVMQLEVKWLREAFLSFVQQCSSIQPMTMKLKDTRTPFASEERT